jgi:hypothetical protein
MRRIRVFIAIGLAALLAVGASALALASGGSSPPSAKHAARARFATALAAQLGKPTDRVQAALVAERVDVLRARAARLQQRAQTLAKGVRPGRVGGRGAGQAWEAALAKRLDVPVTKLDAALRAALAKSLPPRLLRRLAMIRGS